MNEPRGCDAVALTCIDFRFVERVHAHLGSRRLLGRTDLVAWPGGALPLALADPGPILETLELAHRLHAPAEVLLVAHHDCGWLGGSQRFDGPDDEARYLDEALARAAEVVTRRLPDVRVRQVRLTTDAGVQDA